MYNYPPYAQSMLHAWGGGTLFMHTFKYDPASQCRHNTTYLGLYTIVTTIQYAWTLTVAKRNWFSLKLSIIFNDEHKIYTNKLKDVHTDNGLLLFTHMIFDKINYETKIN